MKNTFITTLLLLTVVFCSAQEKYVPSQENLTNREWFRDAKFGMFIHWGIYSMLADGEWVLTNKSLNEAEYQKLADGFYPSKFNADEWVRIAKDAGMKYICFTSRHHDGFSMFDTKQSDYNIVKATPFKRDVIKELAEACQKHGLKLFFYYSHIDWHRPDYYPWGRTGRNTGRTPSGTWEDYLKFMDAQLTELLTNYGPIGGIWFDGWWDKPDADWQLERQYTLIHRLQPGCLIGNNHHKAPFDGEDFQMFERDLPGQNKAGYSADAEISALPLESCETMNNTWGYNINDRNFKSILPVFVLIRGSFQIQHNRYRLPALPILHLHRRSRRDLLFPRHGWIDHLPRNLPRSAAHRHRLYLCPGNPSKPCDASKYSRKPVLGILLQCCGYSTCSRFVVSYLWMEIKSDVRRCSDELIQLLRSDERAAAESV